MANAGTARWPRNRKTKTDAAKALERNPAGESFVDDTEANMLWIDGNYHWRSRFNSSYEATHMNDPILSRRKTLRIGVASLAAPLLASFASASDAEIAPHIATNTYPWRTFAKRAGHRYERHTDELLGQIAATGITGYEPIVEAPAELDGLGERLKDHGLQMRSIYVNSVLHDKTRVDESMASVITIAKQAKELGTRIVVTNPSPIRWGGTEDKTDVQLRLQAQSLDALGQELRRLGVTLAYHNHDAELRQGGREFHHMLTATDSMNVKFCLDAHWVYRGCGDSEVAVFDALEHYHDRIVELHLRQSNRGVWTESFAMTGDVDYRRLFDYLVDRSIRPHLVLEQAVEQGTPNEHSVVDAHRNSQRNLRQAIT